MRLERAQVLLGRGDEAVYLLPLWDVAIGGVARLEPPEHLRHCGAISPDAHCDGVHVREEKRELRQRRGEFAHELLSCGAVRLPGDA